MNRDLQTPETPLERFRRMTRPVLRPRAIVDSDDLIGPSLDDWKKEPILLTRGISDREGPDDPTRDTL